MPARKVPKPRSNEEKYDRESGVESRRATQRSFSDMPPEAFIRLPEVISLVSLQRTTIYDLIQRGKFPPPKKLTAHASGWRMGEVRAWLLDPQGWQKAAAE